MGILALITCKLGTSGFGSASTVEQVTYAAGLTVIVTGASRWMMYGDVNGSWRGKETAATTRSNPFPIGVPDADPEAEEDGTALEDPEVEKKEDASINGAEAEVLSLVHELAGGERSWPALVHRLAGGERSWPALVHKLAGGERSSLALDRRCWCVRAR